MASLTGRRILLVIGGGIAAYKSLELIREIVRRGGRVRCVLTRAAQEFVTPLSAAGLSGDKVYTDLFSLTDEAEMGHIQLSRAADLVVVAPATADLMAKLAHGHANDLATTLLIATDKRVLLAPAMNVRMWQHPATVRNLAMLEADGALIVGPNAGEMACGEFGPGRMAEPIEIADAIITALALGAGPAPSPAGPLAGTHVIVTSGPTREPLDPVRFISNHSSGRQGHAIARAAAVAGARVTLVSGPVAIGDPAGVTVVRVDTAEQMLAAVQGALPADIAVFCAAVADWRPAQSQTLKMRKTDAKAALRLDLVANPDILATIAHLQSGRPPLVVGFAAETHDVLAHAAAKLERKGCDLIVANDVALTGETAGGVMGAGHNTVHLVSRDGVESWPTLDKDAVAVRLVAHFAARLAARAGAART